MPADPRSPVELRPAAPADLETVATVWAEAWHDGHRGRVPDELVALRGRDYFETRSRELLDHVVMAVAGDEVLGIAIVKDDELQQLMVTGAARGRGVGALLLTEAERRVAAAGHEEIWLAVVPDNTPARAFYEHRGWTDRGERSYDSRTLTEQRFQVPVRHYVKQLG